jgi:hypothetical protein
VVVIFVWDGTFVDVFVWIVRRIKKGKSSITIIYFIKKSQPRI